MTAIIWLKPSESEGRRTHIMVGYRPHLVAQPHEQYMGVQVQKILHSSANECVFPGTSAEVELLLMYFDDQRAECVALYQDLRPGIEFEIREGHLIVGYGCVQRRFTQSERGQDAAPTS